MRISATIATVVLLAVTVVAAQTRKPATGVVVAWFGQPPVRLQPAEVASHVGERVTVCGRVVTLICASSASPLFLRFADSNDDRVTIDVAPQLRASLEPHRRLVDREVCATGAIIQAPPSPVGGPRRYDVLVSSADNLSLTGDRGATLADRVYDSCDADVTPPTIVQQARAQYTTAAMRAGLQGAVELEGIVGADGRVSEIRIVRSLDDKLGLDQQAVKAFRDFRFTPATRGGDPVRFVVQVEISFTVR